MEKNKTLVEECEEFRTAVLNLFQEILISFGTEKLVIKLSKFLGRKN